MKRATMKELAALMRGECMAQFKPEKLRTKKRDQRKPHQGARECERRRLGGFTGQGGAA